MTTSTLEKVARSAWREPFCICFAIVSFTLWAREGFDAQLWTLPIVVAGFGATWFADELWQSHLEGKA